MNIKFRKAARSAKASSNDQEDDLQLKDDPHRLKFRMAAWCAKAGRNYNEDNFQLKDNLSQPGWGFIDTDKIVSLDDKGALLVVCDGMGGMNAGEVASDLAIKAIQEQFAPERLTPQVLNSPETIMRHIKNAIIAADDVIKKDGKQNKDHEGMGSTIVLAWITGKTVYVGWAGDSRAYRFNPAFGLQQLTRDHSYVQELVDSGQLSPELAFDHPDNNIITRSLGDSRKKVSPDVDYFPLYNNDIILLCSDGLSGVLRDSEMVDVIDQNTDSMEKCRTALWNESEKAGWTDNVTIALCQIVSGADDAPKANGQNAVNNKDRSGNSIKWRKKHKKSMLAMFIIALILGVALGIIIAIYFLRENSGPLQYCRDDFKAIVDSCDIKRGKYRNGEVLLDPFKKEIKEKYIKLDSLCQQTNNIDDTCSHVSEYKSLEKDLLDSFNKWRIELIGKCGDINSLIKRKLEGNEIISESEEEEIIKMDRGKNNYSVIINAIKGGKVTASPDIASEGTTITLSIAPNQGYILDSIGAHKTDDVKTTVKLRDSGDKYTFNMEKYNVTVEASFSQQRSYIYEIKIDSSEGGSVKPSHESAAAGEKISLTIEPESNYKFEKIEVHKDNNPDNDVEVVKVDNKSYTFVLPDCNVTVEVSFKSE